ncbi:hypothetical protein GGR57DRAFT_313270 [Xylariaceae sp. FL1272]|nr:hypothetical protein GGR57DRAFT_313270 [Xylariaceae sp. FL1272]
MAEATATTQPNPGIEKMSEPKEKQVIEPTPPAGASEIGDAAPPSAAAPEPPRPTETETPKRQNPISAFFGALRSVLIAMLGLGHGMSKVWWQIPALYGDTATQRPWPQITNFGSGCSAGGKALVYGIYDGVTGVVTQPIRGAKAAGAKGLLQGLFYGLVGLFIKPLQGFWGLIGHPLYGISQSLKSGDEKRPRGATDASPV